MRKSRAVVAASVAAAFLSQSCFATMRYALPEPEARPTLAVHGVVLGEGPDAEVFEFSEVHETRWTETVLVLTGVVEAPGDAEHGQVSTVSFPLAEVDQILVREMDGTRASIIVGGVLMSAAIAIAYLVTGKSQAGVPIGSS